ncbi:MAG: LytR C-terminal domain-containing protein [Actinomycetia bacterium]|nr:LytR C-terminal domain-containing protein [Actinomycetes bacterium]
MKNPWRRIGSPILLLVVVCALAYGGWWGVKALLRPLGAVPVASCVTQRVNNALTTDKVTVRVYNGGTKTGLARSVSGQLQEKGFRIGYVGNTTEKLEATTIMGATADSPEVKLVAGFFTGAVVKADGRADHTVDILLNDTFGGVNPDAPLTVDVPGGVVCLPATPTPKASTPAPPTDTAAAPQPTP